MGYVDKTVSKNERLIKQAKISSLSFLDRYITAVLYILGGLFVIVEALFIKMDSIMVGEQIVSVATVVTAALGGVCFLLLIVLALYRVIQVLTAADKDALISGAVFGRLALFGLVGIAVAAIAVMLGQPNQTFDVVEGILCVVFGGLVLLFAILRYKAIKLVLTDNRVFGRRNIWRTEAFDLPIGKIDNVIVVFSFWGKMFNYATVTIKSVMGAYKYKYVTSAEEFKNLVIDMVTEAEKENAKAE